MVTLNYEQKNQNEKSKNSDSISRCQFENASAQGGFISVAYVISWSEFNKETSEEIGFEQEKREWCGSLSELKSKLEDLRKNVDSCGCSLSDCRVSLAEFDKPELKPENISEIKSLFLKIFNNGKFYFGKTQEEAKEALLEHCRKNEIPTPNEIQDVIDGYQIKWNFSQGFSGSEISLWKSVQKFLHGIFAKLGSDASICQDAAAMLYASGFSTGFDPYGKTSIIFSNDEKYASPIEFLSKLPLNFSEIADYRKTKKDCKKTSSKLPRSRKKVNDSSVEVLAEADIAERAKLFSGTFADALKDEKCTGEQYRYYQRRTDNPKKFYKWLEINSGEKFLPDFEEETDGWLSAATYYSRFRRKSNVASIDCNFLILKWNNSELGFIPTQEQGKELVLSRCRELGLPEPKIISTPDGLEIKWLWNDRMTKKLYANDPFNSRFNDDWDAIQKELYENFWMFGADAKKICATTMFSIPGSKDTRKTLKADDRIIREIHKGETVESYRDIQRALGLEETFENEQTEVLDEILEQKWQGFSRENSELVKDWIADVLKIHQKGQDWVCFAFFDENRVWNHRWVKAFEIRKFLMNLVRKPEFHERDFYVSQGEFFDRKRVVENVASMKAAFVDLDYKVLAEYRQEISENPTPEKSGRQHLLF